MIPIQQHGKRWLILTLTLSTSVLALASIGASQPVVFADENLHLQSQKNTNKIEVLDWEAFSKKLKDYSSDQRFNVFKLGLENRVGTLSTWKELEEFGKNHDFLVINDKGTQNIHDFPHILVVNKGDILVHSPEEYKQKVQELQFRGDQANLDNTITNYTAQRIHALFPIHVESTKRQLLDAAGLKTADDHARVLNDNLTIYSHGYSVDNKFFSEYSHFSFGRDEKVSKIADSMNITKERFTANDDTILEMIRESKANIQLTDSEKVKAFVLSMANKAYYDWAAANTTGVNKAGLSYYFASDLFAVTQKKLAACVGFSTTAARAFNFMGLPAYVVTGVNAKGDAHATTRVFYDGKWHTIDATGVRSVGRNNIYTQSHFDNIGRDSYQEVDSKELEKLPSGKNNYMVINKEYEEWAKRQKIADLLLINKEKSLVDQNHVAYIEPEYVDNGQKERLTTIYKKFTETMKSVSVKSESGSEGLTNLLNYVKNDLEKLNSDSRLTKEEFEKIEKNLKSNITFFRQLAPQEAADFEKGNEYTSYLELANNAKFQIEHEKTSTPMEHSSSETQQVHIKVSFGGGVEEETSSLGNTEMVSPSSETAQNTVASKEESDAKLPYVEPSSKESSEAQVNTVSSPQVSSASPTSSETTLTEVATEVSESSVVESDSASPTSPETNSTEAVTTSQEMAGTSVSAPQVSSEIQTLSETAPTEVATETPELSALESNPAPQTSLETTPTEEVTETPEPSVVESNSASPTSPETNSAEAVTTSQEMAEPSVSVPQVSSEIPTSSETAPAEVATEVSEESSSASQPSPETTPTETVTTSQEVAESRVSAPQVSSEIPTSPETNSTEVVVAKQEVADSLVSAPQTSSASLTLEVPKNEHLDEKADATMPNGVEANTHEAVSVPTSDIRVQNVGSAAVPQPQSLSATVLIEAISTVEPVSVATSSQERSAVAGEVKVPASLERSNNSVKEEKVVDSNTTIENQETEKKEVLTSENVLNSLVTIWVALSTSFFMRYFSRGK
ncbi:ribonuclease [Streptococcus suis]|uniref:transglutaminase domain-containing protein n=1 Tax=Streptococcus suis TaxID=1307 RepID=UPI0005CCA72F|nr:transglutaminase domain-containing protein [Streptococcus suis]NQG77248.1 ribonuclease [Streptococcus suis]NQN47700.1 ribonuclease [Streptococcus suis]NQN55732.1 ribonuclease [Streptococcus suis]NQN76405.1 ribonuclease [Streptococcus suis]NQP68865.1 ribonuclease [Streptococcus suis]